MLFVVATPIGNLEDVTHRALRTLREADFVLAEDTRVTKKLLDRYGIKKEVRSWRQQTSLKDTKKIVRELENGANVALVTDAGTPGLSDPGGKLVEAAVKALVPVSPVPGPSALTALLSVAGVPADRFLFLGFAPQKGKAKFVKEILASSHPVVFFDSPHRVAKTLGQIAESDPGFRAVAGRELTKTFEEVLRGPLDRVAQTLQNTKPRGEFAVLLLRK